jgi:hypothetical protein
VHVLVVVEGTARELASKCAVTVLLRRFEGLYEGGMLLQLFPLLYCCCCQLVGH